MEKHDIISTFRSPDFESGPTLLGLIRELSAFKGALNRVRIEVAIEFCGVIKLDKSILQ